MQLQNFKLEKEDMVVNYGKFVSKELVLRTISALLLAPIILFIVYQGGIVYIGTVIIIAVLMAFEWSDLLKNKYEDNQKALQIWKLIALVYILLPCTSLIWLRAHTNGAVIIIWLLAIVWVTDIGAYIGGNLIGGWKLCPKISPKKTWSGFVCGILAAYLVGIITSVYAHSHKPSFLIALSIVLSIYGQIGDLIESWIKRKFGVKNSGHIIPGHGGILDRVDSLVPVAPKVVLVVLFDKWGMF
ncbi:Phosphatidate cytidylyltransferase [Rickettsiales bacterium Ac37b]|nr:Phosphatidate cytidylyltransferase [Rickettsiales bacterium Ac37b]